MTYQRRMSSIFVIIITLISPFNNVFAIEYGGIGGRPAYPQTGNERTQSIFIHTLEPGVTKKEGVKVINNTKQVKSIIVYTTDSTPSTDGAFACKQKSEPKIGISKWITISQEIVTLNPMSSQIVPFTISVPNDADTGEQNGCILIQESKEKMSGQSGATLSIRTGLRVAITVPGEIVRNLELSKFLVTKNKNQITLSPEVTNTGNVSIDTDLKVVTKNIFGKVLQEHGGVYPVLRGQSSSWNFEVKKMTWGGFYSVQASIAYDQIQKDGQVKKIIQKSKKELVYSTPSIIGIIGRVIILLAVITLAYYLWYNRKRNKIIKKTWVDYPVQEGDTIVELSNKVDIPWKRLAHINLILPPYVLKPGTTIKIPPHKIIERNNDNKTIIKKIVKKRVV